MKELSGIKVMFKRSFAYIIPSRARRILITASVVMPVSFLCPKASAQDLFMDDTVNIRAVTVTAAASGRHAPGTVVSIDTALMARHGGSDLASLLQSSSLLSVKRYGNHGLAAVSIRGMSGSHTLVTWNGLPVNAPGNGYTDFAIIPLSVATTVRVTSGGSDLNDITGAIGGKIELSSDPVFNGLTEGSLALGTGSYGNFSSSATLRSGTDNSSLRLSLWGGTARNDFRYINRNAPGGPEGERRVNAAAATGGVTSDLSFRMKGSLLSAHIWYNEAERELPGPVTTVQQDFGERQRDRSLRGVIRYSSQPARLSAEIMAGGSYDINLYFHENAGYNGENRSETYMARARITYRLNRKMELMINAGDEYRKALTLNYAGHEVQNIFSASLAAKYSPLPRLRFMLQARQLAVTGITVAPELTAAASWLMSANGEHIMKASFTRNTKLPCLNDLYWVPGGNPDLTAETSTGGEASWSFSRVTLPGMKNTIGLTLHASGVDNLIQWLPGETGLWAAENIRSVSVRGGEARAEKEVSVREWQIKGQLNYALTRSRIAGSDLANDRSVGSQVIYMPLHHGNLNLDARWKAIRAGVTAVTESRRFTTSDNSEWLPASFTADMFIGTGFRAGPTGIKADLRVNNIAGTASESVRNYPMPLRTFNLKITLTWSENPKEYENNN
jgi:iron complex outermembrane receptor protein